MRVVKVFSDFMAVRLTLEYIYIFYL